MNGAISARFARAVELTGPRSLARTAGLTAEGYWLDETRFYFLAEKVDARLGRVVGVPSIADCASQRVDEIISLDELGALLAARAPAAGSVVDALALSGATFDVPALGTLAVSVNGWDFLVDTARREVVEVRPSLPMAALYSPDRRHACFVKGYDLWLRDMRTGAERPLTTGGAPNLCYGQESESNLSALAYRARPTPMGLWSPDGQWLLTHRIDERSVPDLALVQSVPPSGDRPLLHGYKYPFPGDPMPMAVFVAIHVPSQRVVTFEDFPTPVLGYSPFSSFYRSAWFGGPESAWGLRIDRFAKQGDLIHLDLARGVGRVAVSERVDAGYLEFHQSMVGRPNVRTLEGSQEIVWFSERDGWGHLYLYDAAAGVLKNRITAGDWMVRDIVHVDESKRTVLFTACGLEAGSDPAQRRLCSANLDGSGFTVLPCGSGDTAARLGGSPNGRYVVVHDNDVVKGNDIRIVDLQTLKGFSIAAVSPSVNEVPPRRFTVLAADGRTAIHGVMLVPSDFDERQTYPLIDYIYPGPHISHQPQTFGSVRLAFSRALAELGFVVVMLDTRGMPFRSRAEHQLGYGECLEPQLSDHAAAARALCERHAFLDRERVGMIGHSSGGAATARAMFDYGDVFKVGVSVCGSHDSSMVTTMWSDKYRGEGTREDWLDQANSSAAHKLSGKLLLMCGDMDDNVHISQTLKLVDALVRANRDFDLLIVPNEGHDLMMTSGYVQRRAWEYFVRHLRGEAPPPGFEIRFEPHELARFETCYWRDFWP